MGEQYSKNSNIDNADKLSGRLFLIVGELDTNVPPESTMRFVNALIQAGKDFDILVVPGADHGAGSPVTQRRLQDFFVHALQGKEPPDRNKADQQATPAIQTVIGSSRNRNRAASDSERTNHPLAVACGSVHCGDSTV